MLSDKVKLHAMIDRIEVGLINRADIIALRGLVERLDEMDDLVDTVTTCRTQEIPVLRDRYFPMTDDEAPGRP